MKHVFILKDESLMVMDVTTGEQITIHESDERFSEACKHVATGNFEGVLDMAPKKVVTTFFNASDKVSVKIEDGEGTITIEGTSYPLHNAILDRILKMNSQGFNCTPMINFLSNLYKNPSSTAVEELFGFIDVCNLPITEEGHFIAYKIVKEDYKDIYSGTMDNSVGKTLSMSRNTVDDNRDNVCSKGLHFCSKEYLNYYGTQSRNKDRCLLVKINPADVVSIPSDYNNAKGRTAKYVVVGEVPAGWRAELPKNDYTNRAVVDEYGNEWVDQDEDGYDYDEDECIIEELDEGFDPISDNVETARRIISSGLDEDDEDDGFEAGYADALIGHAGSYDDFRYSAAYNLGYTRGFNEGCVRAEYKGGGI